MKTITDKKFDCVKSVRKERDRIAADIKVKNTAKEVLEYFRKRRQKHTVRDQISHK
jgi:hypothetical protein